MMIIYHNQKKYLKIQYLFKVICNRYSQKSQKKTKFLALLFLTIEQLQNKLKSANFMSSNLIYSIINIIGNCNIIFEAIV